MSARTDGNTRQASARPVPPDVLDHETASLFERRKAMTMMRKIMFGGAGLAALATAAPSAAQYGYAYSNGYGYNRNMTSVAAQQCSAAVQNRLYRGSGLGGIVGQLLGANTSSGGRVLSITQVSQNRGLVRVRGLATSGRSAGYGAYGYGAYGASAYSYQPDLSFRCDVDYRGQVRNVDINRR
jgi:hypothetical protein